MFTPQYHEFCENTLGKYLLHVPRTSSTPQNSDFRRKFGNNYHSFFGEIPQLWDIKSNLKDPCGGCGPDACTPDDCSSELYN